MKRVGILGGLGPLAGAYFYLRLCELTPAQSDEEHLSVVLDADTAIPSRLNYLRHEGPSPVEALRRVGQRLIDAGAEFISMPSSTTSYFHGALQEQLSVPLLSLVDEVGEALRRDGCGHIGILGTTPTRSYRIYEQALERRDIHVVYPDDQSQQDTMDIILQVKGQASSEPRRGTLAERLRSIMDRPWAQNTDGVLLACTELPVAARSLDGRKNGRPVFSATDILARATIAFATSRHEAAKSSG